MSDGQYACKVIVVCVVLLISSILLGISFATIPVTGVGLYYNPNTVKVDRSKVYKSGRHYVSPGSSFFVFPTSYELIEFSNRYNSSLMCWTKDKQNLYLELFVNVQIEPDKVVDIYNKYTLNYWEVWKEIVEASLKSSTKDFDTVDFFDKRSELTAAVRRDLIAALSPEGVQVATVHIGEINIPDRFEDAVIRKVCTEQEASTTLMERSVLLVQANATVITFQAAADATVISGKANSIAKVVTESAAARGKRIVQEAVGKGLFEVADELNLDVDQMLKYKLARQIADAPESTELYVGFEKSFLSTKART